jgi:hypothetical protein
MLGCAPAHRFLDFATHKREVQNAIVEVRKIADGSPRCFGDYSVTVHRDRLPAGVEPI